MRMIWFIKILGSDKLLRIEQPNQYRETYFVHGAPGISVKKDECIHLTEDGVPVSNPEEAWYDTDCMVIIPPYYLREEFARLIKNNP